jgi:hypothetical protein
MSNQKTNRKAKLGKMLDWTGNAYDYFDRAEAALRLAFDVRRDDMGNVALVHESGSYIQFNLNGDVTVHASRDYRQTQDGYCFVSSEISAEEWEASLLRRLELGEFHILEMIRKLDRCAHLREAAERIAKEQGYA